MILFVDDEMREMDSYAEELKLPPNNYKLIFKNKVDQALDFFEQNYEDIDLLILDIMMPPGTAFEGDNNENGLRTGVRFYYRIRESAPELPVIIFTNVSDERVMERFSREKRCWFLRKEAFLPYQLAERVRSILG